MGHALTLVGSGAHGNQLTSTSGVAFGGAFLTPSLHLDDSVVSVNLVSGSDRAYAGGIIADTMTASGSTIDGNRVTSTNGEAFAAGVLTGAGEISASTISGNATAGATAHGGGLVHWTEDSDAPGDLRISNVTVTGNVVTGATSSAGGVEQFGAGPFSTTGPLAIDFSTIADNSAVVGANIGAANAAAPVTSLATVVSDPQGGGTNCGGLTVTDQGYTHVTDASCGTTAAPDPQLGALADNGGPTQTMLPAATSPLLDRVPDDTCTTTVTTDERGITRPQGSACDIGAVEVEVAPPDPDPPLTPPETPTTPAATAATAPTAIVAEPRFTG